MNKNKQNLDSYPTNKDKHNLDSYPTNKEIEEDIGDNEAKYKKSGGIWWEALESKTHVEKDILEEVLIDWRQSSHSLVMINNK